VTSSRPEPGPLAPPGGRSFAFLVNPASGGGAAPGAVVPVARRLRDAGAEVEVTYSPGPRATHDLVAAAVARGDVVVSVGGDGMLSSLAGEVARLGGTLGVVPAGRGNDFARALGLPSEPLAQADLLLAGSTRRVDLISWAVGGRSRVVAGSVYAGVDARAAEIVDRLRRLPGPVQYPFAAVRALATYRPARYRVVVDGVASEHDAATVVVAGSRYYGQGMAIAPDARLDDGLLDVVVIEAATKRSLIRSLPSVYDGRHVALPEVTVLRGARVEISADARVPVPVGGDGEPLGVLPPLSSLPAEVGVLPGALSVIA
jgi:YegS/Rv2252/BmrU family lipid kinase